MGSKTPEKHSRKNRGLVDISFDVLLSGVSASIAKTLVAPVERMKLVLQTQASNASIQKGETKAYTGIVSVFTRTYREQGLISFWRGNMATLLKYVPLQVLNFTLHGQLKRSFPKYDSSENPYKFFFANMAKGALAGGTSIMFVYPLDYIRTKMAADLGKTAGQREFYGFLDCFRKVLKQGGLSAFYTAFPLSLINVTLYRGIYFGFYETAMNSEKQSLGIWWSLFYAQLSTNTAGIVVYPFDTIRRNLVLQSAQTDKSRPMTLDKGYIACFNRLYQERGISGLYAGCLINLVRGIGSSLVLVLYDLFKGNMDGNKVKND
jgi:solute carrier family 25 (mitochondrial adenine nucleotide translocator), member 4/5/6/31